jgi:hypothetical protein
MSYSVEAEGMMERANPLFTSGSPDHASRLGRVIDATLKERDGRIEDLEIALRAALSFVQGRHTDPNDGHAVMVIAAMRGALAKFERN